MTAHHRHVPWKAELVDASVLSICIVGSPLVSSVMDVIGKMVGAGYDWESPVIVKRVANIFSGQKASLDVQFCRRVQYHRYET